MWGKAEGDLSFARVRRTTRTDLVIVSFYAMFLHTLVGACPCLQTLELCSVGIVVTKVCKP